MYVACTTILLIFDIISVVVNSYLLDFVVLLKLGVGRTVLVDSIDFKHCPDVQ